MVWFHSFCPLLFHLSSSLWWAGGSEDAHCPQLLPQSLLPRVCPRYLWCLLGGTAAYLWLSLMQRGLEGCRAGMTLLCLPSFLVASLGIWYFPSLAVFEICSTPYLLCCFTWCLHFQASWSGFKLFLASSVWDVVTRLSLMLPLQ